MLFAVVTVTLALLALLLDCSEFFCLSWERKSGITTDMRPSSLSSLSVSSWLRRTTGCASMVMSRPSGEASYVPAACSISAATPLGVRATLLPLRQPLVLSSRTNRSQKSMSARASGLAAAPPARAGLAPHVLLDLESLSLTTRDLQPAAGATPAAVSPASLDLLPGRK